MCARYAFPPNNLQYCGPLKARVVQEYLTAQTAAPPLTDILKQFETLYPYLVCIAQANKIQDPFDPRVVEAYWIGNSLLQRVTMNKIYTHYTEGLKLNKRIKQNELKWLFGKIQQGAQVHHTYHVLNVFTRTGHHSVAHTIESIDNCRIGWGYVVMYDELTVTVKYQPIVYREGTLQLGTWAEHILANPFGLTARYHDWVSFHWGILCAILRPRQVRSLQSYTKHALELANTTI